MGSLPTRIKSFSEDIPDERTFELAGKTYTWKIPFWEDMATIFDESLAELKEARSENDKTELTTKGAIEDLIQRIKTMLEPESAERFHEAAYGRDNPIAIRQFNEVYRWLLEVTSGRPTIPSSDLAGGDGEPAASSQGSSS